MATEKARCPRCGNAARLTLTGVTKDGERLVLVKHMVCGVCGHAFKVGST